MKVIQTLTAVVLAGTLSVAVGSNVAIAKGRHQVSENGSRAIGTSDRGQKLEGNHGIGAVKSSIAAPGNNAGGKGNQNVPGQAGPQNAGTLQSGKNQIGDRSDGSHHETDLNTVHPGGTDAGKGTPVIADGPGHKTNRPADTTKKTTTIFRPIREPQHPTGLGNIERNSIGAVIHHDANPKLGLDPKVGARVNGVPASRTGPTTKTIPNASSISRTAVRPGHNLTDPPQRGSIINGSSVSRSNVTSVGGPTKNIVGALSGNSFKPKHP
jgi:hypothetical protein